MTSCRLCLVRHAEAVASAGSDADRPLTVRGRADAAAVGRWLAAEGVVPDLAVVSTARRARETWQAVAAALPAAPPPVPDLSLYAGTLEDYLEVVQAAPADAATVLLVGHNPPVAALARALTGAGGGQAGDRLAEGYPPGGVALVDLPGGWVEAGPGAGVLRGFAVPRG